MKLRPWFAALLLTAFATSSMAKTETLYITTLDPARMGILVADFDSQTGVLSAPKMVVEADNPSHFTFSADGTHLYVCNSGTPGGVSAYAVDKKTHALKLLNFKQSKGRGPSYVSVDKSGHYVLDANYGGGFVEIYSLAKDGSLDQQTAFVEHQGSSVNPERQTKPYAHWFRTDPSGKFAVAMDLGTDQLVIYKFDAKTGALAPNDPPATKVEGGMGPRHLGFHPNGRWAYGTAEMGNKVMAFRWDDAKGTMTQFQTVDTLSADFTGKNTTAEIMVRPDGKFLYASNRGDDSIVVYSIDAKTGELTLKQRTPSRGKIPRYFTFDPSGKWLIVSNQDSANITVFSIDEKTGELAPKGEPVPVGKPAGVVFLR